MPKLRGTAVPALTNAFGKSEVITTIMFSAWYHHPWWSRGKVAPFFKDLFDRIPRALTTDVRCLGRALIQALCAPLATTYRLAHGTYNWLRGTSPTSEKRSGQQTAVLDL